MSQIDFDDYADDYEHLVDKQTSFFDDGDYFAEYKVLLAREISKLSSGNIMDFGCGIGQSIPFFQRHFPGSRITGCDVSRRSLQRASEKYSYAEFVQPNDLSADSVFDLIFASGVFHHIPPSDRIAALRFCYRHLTDGGILIVFEHNPYNPITRGLVATCPFDKDAALLSRKELRAIFAEAGLKRMQSGYTLFFPSPLRAMRSLERYLRFLPFGGQYYVAGERH